MERYQEQHEGMTFEIREMSAVVDDRSTKTYRRRVGVHISISHPKFPSGMCFLDFQDTVSGMFQVKEEHNLKVKTLTNWSTSTILVQFSKLSDRPSKICSQAAVWAWLGKTPEDVAQKMVDAALISHRKQLEEMAVDDRVLKANHVRSHTVKKIRESAKAIVLYSQRLAGLKAELQSEIELLYKTSQETIASEAREAGFDERVIRAGIQAAGEILAKDGGEEDHFFGGHSPKSIDKNLVR